MLSAIEISAVFDGKTVVHLRPGKSWSRACLYCQRYLQQYAELIGTYNAYRVDQLHQIDGVLVCSDMESQIRGKAPCSRNATQLGNYKPKSISRKLISNVSNRSNHIPYLVSESCSTVDHLSASLADICRSSIATTWL
jgi:hypothetical protein